MKMLKRILKVISWRLRGSPRCRLCKKPLYDWRGGELIGKNCAKKEIAKPQEGNDGKDTDGPTA